MYHYERSFNLTAYKIVYPWSNYIGFCKINYYIKKFLSFNDVEVNS